MALRQQQQQQGSIRRLRMGTNRCKTKLEVDSNSGTNGARRLYADALGCAAKPCKSLPRLTATCTANTTNLITGRTCTCKAGYTYDDKDGCVGTHSDTSSTEPAVHVLWHL